MFAQPRRQHTSLRDWIVLKRCCALHRLVRSAREERTADSHKEHSKPRCRCASRAGPPLHRFLRTPAPRVNCSPGTEAHPLRRRRTARRRVRKIRDVAPKENTAAKSAMKTNAHNFIHACHMNTVCVVIVLAKLIRAPLSSRRRPPLCYPSSAFLVASVGCQSGGRATVGGAYV